MNEGAFEGTSQVGNFQEALNNAIGLAKKKLETDHIVWELQKISGESGSLASINVLSVKIYVKSHELE